MIISLSNLTTCDETEFVTLDESSEDEVVEEHWNVDAEEINQDFNNDFDGVEQTESQYSCCGHRLWNLSYSP